jgi:hypothetical protein
MTLALVDRRTQPTNPVIDYPRLLAGPVTPVLIPQLGETNEPGWTSTDLSASVLSSDVAKETTPISGVRERDLLFVGLLVWLAAVSRLPRRQAELESQALEPAEAVERLRHWTGLSVGGVADLLGVTRRSLYHWSTGATRPRHDERLLGLVGALEQVAASWAPWELRQWLVAQDARQLVRSGDIASLRRLLEDAVRPSAIRRLRPARTGYQEEIEPLEPDALRRHFMVAVGPRPTTAGQAAGAPYVPRELTDSAPPEGE